MPRLHFVIHISAEEYLRYYQFRANQVVVATEEGPTLRLPARHFRPFITHDGIHGRFCVIYDAREQKLLDLKRLS